MFNSVAVEPHRDRCVRCEDRPDNEGEYISALDHRPDLIISDYRLPAGQTGIEAIARLRGIHGASIPAFLVSGDTAPERLREAIASGYHLLHKPLQPRQLIRLIKHLRR